MSEKRARVLMRARQNAVLFTILGAGLIAGVAYVGLAIQDNVIEQQRSVRELYGLVLTQLKNINRTILLTENAVGPEPIGETDFRARYREAVDALTAGNDRIRDWTSLNRMEQNIGETEAREFHRISDQLYSYADAAGRIARDEKLSYEELKSNARTLTTRAHKDLSELLEVGSGQLEAESQRLLEELKLVGMLTLGVCLAVAVFIWMRMFRPMLRAFFEQHEKLLQSVLEAQAASRAKTEFLANISHEIRTPMTAILGYSEILRHNESSPDEIERMTGVIHENASHLLRLIDDILDVSKAEVGNVAIVKEKVALRTLLREIHSLLQVKAMEKKIDFRIVTQGFIPDVIESDGTRLKQVLFNIVGNAVKFTDQGAVKVHVSMVGNDGPKLVRFLVTDTGPGIPAHMRERLFQPFMQVDASNTRRHRGTGLGLVLAQRMARLLGGDVQLRWSEEGRGTEFEITIGTGEAVNELTVAAAGGNREERLLASVSGGGTECDSAPLSGLNGARILVVDDAAENGRLFKIYLEKAKAQVDLADNGFDAIKLARSQKYDLIFLDLQMPGKDGYSVLRDLRSQRVHVPIVALTAHAMAEEVARTRRAGFDDHVSKPVSLGRLVEVAGKYVGNGAVS